MAKEYEITYLTDPQLAEDARGELDGAVDSKIHELTGSVGYSSPNTRRRLAYPIQDKPMAFLRTLQAELEPDKIEELRQYLVKQNGVLRAAILQTARREEIQPDILEKYEQKRGGKPAAKPSKPAKKVTMEEVEKGIEEALTEEVK